MMDLQWRPRIVYGGEGTETDLALTLPQRPWTPVGQHTGGSERSAIGIRETYTIRREDLLELRLRLTEAEWPDVYAWIGWAQDSGQSFRWFPDRAASTEHTVDLEAPAAGEEIRPERTEFGAVFEVSITLRRLTPGGFGERYYP